MSNTEFSASEFHHEEPQLSHYLPTPHTVGAATIPETTSIPEPGGVYIIRHIQSGKVITMINGRVILKTAPRQCDGIYWRYDQFLDGWASFRNTVSGLNLGYGQLRCTLRPREPRGYSLYLKCPGDTLAALAVFGEGRNQGITMVDGVNQAAAAIWEFLGSPRRR